ncbi:MAG: TrpB-like pyridoxal-phosphate dependent enzyme, partial [Prevotella nanceiensis]|nr:TrpB-like pyridoxal-phosphate dependent enzyme [Hoylesella nanceiensis]
MSKQKRFYLSEKELPTQWYNIQADLKTKPLPLLNPQTKEPMGVEDLAHIF